MPTTGFEPADNERRHPLLPLSQLALRFVGGSTGSTAGRLKTSRIVLLAHVVSREFKRMVERSGIFAIRLGGQMIHDDTVQGLLNLIYLAFMVKFVACLLLAGMGIDILTAITAVADCMFNIGPGFGSVGPLENFAHLPALAKWLLAVVMIAGRLEFYAVLLIFTPAFWRR
jgi:trk system potassium uptake protein TrkH